MSEKKQGPHVVAIGGGRGLATALRAARRYAADITAVVSVADDGGSSGLLSAAYGLVAPGDLRKCLVALAAEDHIAADVFEYRFDAGPLGGHSVGNVVIAGLEAVCGGILPALEACTSLLGCAGRVLPVSTQRMQLEAEVEGGDIVRGQAHITAQATRIRRIRIHPFDSKPAPGVLEAITAANQVIIGPGSLYTSVIPPLLVEGVREAVSESRALKVYVCNLMGQRAESVGLTAVDHYRALIEHGICCDVLLYHPWGRDAPEGAVLEGNLTTLGHETKAVACYLADSSDPSSHDPLALATALSNLG